MTIYLSLRDIIGHIVISYGRWPYVESPSNVMRRYELDRKENGALTITRFRQILSEFTQTSAA